MQAYSTQQNFDYFNDEKAQELFVSVYHEEETNQQGMRIYRCTFPECGRIFRFKSEITRHCFNHSSTRPFHCKHKGCNKAFKRLDALENHVRIHTKTTPFICNFPSCEEKFPTKAGLRYHLLKHKDERSYKCELPGCGKSFVTTSHLIQHQKTSAFHTKIASKRSLNEKTLTEYREIEQNYASHDSQIEMKEIPTKGSCCQNEIDLGFNQGDIDLLILEFFKPGDGYSC